MRISLHEEKIREIEKSKKEVYEEDRKTFMCKL